jgi:hypothetical protein
MLPPFRRPHCLQTGRCNAHCRGNPMPRCDAFYRTAADVMKLILLSIASDSLCRSSCCSAMRPRASQLSPACQRIQWGYPALKSVIAGIPNSPSPMYARCFSPWCTCVYPVRRGYLGDELRECIPWILFRRITQKRRFFNDVISVAELHVPGDSFGAFVRSTGSDISPVRQSAPQIYRLQS